MTKKIVLAYSGGLDTSAIIPWLKENYDCEVIAFVGDVGQGEKELEGIEEKAAKSGASACRVMDLKREFIEEFVFPTLLFGSVYEERYLLGTSMARPVLARGQVMAAREFGATAVAHGCTGKGNDQVRFESTYAALAPDLEVIAPWRLWTLRSRGDLIDYIEKHKVPCAATREKIYSRDRNLWHISHEGGALEDPWNAPPDDVWMLTKSIAQAPAQPRDVRIAFEKGVPVSIDGKSLRGEQLVAELNAIAGEHGVGRIDICENRLVGMKSRGVYETPGGTVLYEALKALKEVVLDRESRAYLGQASIKFAQIVYDGQWFTPLREALQALSRSLAEVMTGEVVVRLEKGHATATQRRSPHSLFSEAFATFDKDSVYDHKHAEGFIRLFSLPSRIRALKREGKA
jgi:argininosuccinate synthase